jgi:flagella basal body P-ring formation protein FlgA
VRRGDLVDLIYRCGTLAVRTRGIAVTDGRKGRAIEVLNPSSGRRVHGRVLGPGIVVVGPMGGER